MRTHPKPIDRNRRRHTLALAAVMLLTTAGTFAAGTSPAHADSCQRATTGYFGDPTATVGIRGINAFCYGTDGSYLIDLWLVDGGSFRYINRAISSPPWGGGWVTATWSTNDTWVRADLWISTNDASVSADIGDVTGAGFHIDQFLPRR